MNSKQGFATLSKEKHKELSSKGGKRKVRKGFATLSPEDRSKIARKAANALWEKRRKERHEVQL